MNEGLDSYYNLAERIEDSFTEIDSAVCADLRGSDGKYMEMWREAIKLQEDFPAIPRTTEGGGAVSLSAEEHDALLRYLWLKNEMENIERKQIYFRGHMDGYAYLKKIGAI